MFTCPRLLHLSRSKLPMNCSKLRMSVFAPSSALVRKGKEFPNGISLEVLNLETHDLTSLRKLLVQAFVFNQEPIIHTLCERAYPGVPMREKLPQIERQFEKFFTDQFLARKIEQGMSVVAIEKGDGQRYVSSAFVERYSGAIYTSELRLLRDPFWQYGFRFMGALHAQARPVLSQYESKNLAFMSHGATCPRFATSGIMEAIMDGFLSRLAREGFDAVYGIVTTKRVAKWVEERFGFVPVAEIKYADYEMDGEKVFAHLAEQFVSAKAVLKVL